MIVGVATLQTFQSSSSWLSNTFFHNLVLSSARRTLGPQKLFRINHWRPGASVATNMEEVLWGSRGWNAQSWPIWAKHPPWSWIFWPTIDVFVFYPQSSQIVKYSESVTGLMQWWSIWRKFYGGQEDEINRAGSIWSQPNMYLEIFQYWWKSNTCFRKSFWAENTIFSWPGRQGMIPDWWNICLPLVDAIGGWDSCQTSCVAGKYKGHRGGRNGVGGNLGGAALCLSRWHLSKGPTATISSCQYNNWSNGPRPSCAFCHQRQNYLKWDFRNNLSYFIRQKSFPCKFLVIPL